jgi:hypothetical protein
MYANPTYEGVPAPDKITVQRNAAITMQFMQTLKHSNISLRAPSAPQPSTLQTDTIDDNMNDFQTVLSSKTTAIATLISKKKFRFGLHFSFISPKADASINPTDIRTLFELISSVDPCAIFLPYDNTTRSACTIKKIVIKENVNFKTLLNMTCIDWGSPKDGKSKVSFSFYLASDIIKSSLQELKKDDDMMAYLQKGKFNLASHCLLESNIKSIGFFLGKDPDHTWYLDIQARFQRHINSAHSPASTTVLRWEAGAKDDVHPCQVKRATLRSDGGETNVVMVSVGAKDIKTVEEFLDKVPFPDTELVRMSWKRTAKTSFATRLNDHTTLSNNSRAVKVTGTTPDLRDTLRLQATQDPKISQLIIDIAENGRTPEDGTAYIQCHEKDKAYITKWTQSQINQFKHVDPNGRVPTIETTFRLGESATPTEAILPPSRFQHISTDTAYTTYASKSQSSRRPQKQSVPPVIDTNRRTFADALRKNTKLGGERSTTTDTSSLGSPTNTATTHTTGDFSHRSAREIELEDIVSHMTGEMETRIQDETAKNNRAMKKQQEKYETIILNVQKNNQELRKELDTQKDEHDTKIKEQDTKIDEMKEYMEEMRRMLASHLQTQTSPARKKTDNKRTPTKQPKLTDIQTKTFSDHDDSSMETPTIDGNNDPDFSMHDESIDTKKFRNPYSSPTQDTELKNDMLLDTEQSSDEASWDGNINENTGDTEPTDMVTDEPLDPTDTNHERDKTNIKTRSKGTAEPTC